MQVATTVIALILATSSGCLIVPKSVETVRKTAGVSGPVAGPVGPVEIVIESSLADVVVTSRRPRRCRRTAYEIIETTKSMEPRMWVADVDDPLTGIAMAVVAPWTLGVSGAITLLAVLYVGSTTSLAKTEAHRSFDCPVAAKRLPVRLELPSGAIVDGETDTRGTWGFTLPESEPEAGTLTVSSPGIAPQSTGYSRVPRPTPAGSVEQVPRAVQEVVLDCGVLHHLTGEVEVTFTSDNLGKLASIATQHGTAEFGACIAERLETARFPRSLRQRAVTARFRVPG